METKKSVLIITDGTDSAVQLAECISVESADFRVRIIAASDFTGSEILPAAFFYIGCEQPNPPSFEHLEMVLRHINLVGRSCGIFSTGKKQTLSYLSKLVKDCEARVGEPFFAPAGAARAVDVSRWVKKVNK